MHSTRPALHQRIGRGILAALCGAVLMVALPMTAVQAQQAGPGKLSALARSEPERSGVRIAGEDLLFDLGLSQPVPWRLRYLAEPPRIVLDFREVDFTGLAWPRMVGQSNGQITEIRAGRVSDGWSRMVIALDRPRLVAEAELQTSEGGATGVGALLRLRFQPTAPETFAIEAAVRDPAVWALPAPAVTSTPRPPRGKGPLKVVLDPGHGGLDPGAEAGGLTEAQLMLTFALELKEALVRSGLAEVSLTREDNSFVPLETRVGLAHQAGAHVFLSLHADAVTEGVASGATIYTLAAAASDEAAAALAERHERDALMSGVDLTGQDDLIAGVLMDMARVETAPRSEKLADALVAALRGAKLPLHKVPRRGAAFSVLKAPDIPSLLIELGYMSSPADLARLRDPKWRAQMAEALVAGLGVWAVNDAAEAVLLRQ